MRNLTVLSGGMGGARFLQGLLHGVRRGALPGVAADATGAAGSYKSQPWWEPLSMCAAVFIDQPQQTDKFRTIAAAAMLRLMEDRKIKMEDAGALVIPHIKGKAGTRAEIMMSGYGRARVEKNCDDLMVQYKAL